MSSDQVSQEEIILDWLSKQPGKKFDDRVSPDALAELMHAMRHFGYTKVQLLKAGFIDEVVRNVCHDWSKRPKLWKEVTRKKIRLAVAAAFPLEIPDISDAERARMIAAAQAAADADAIRASLPPPVERPQIEEAPEEGEAPKEIVPMDRSMFKNIQTTPVDTDDLLAELGLKDE